MQYRAVVNMDGVVGGRVDASCSKTNHIKKMGFPVMDAACSTPIAVSSLEAPSHYYLFSNHFE